MTKGETLSRGHNIDNNVFQEGNPRDGARSNGFSANVRIVDEIGKYSNTVADTKLVQPAPLQQCFTGDLTVWGRRGCHRPHQPVSEWNRRRRGVSHSQQRKGMFHRFGCGIEHRLLSDWWCCLVPVFLSSASFPFGWRLDVVV